MVITMRLGCRFLISLYVPAIMPTTFRNLAVFLGFAAALVSGHAAADVVIEAGAQDAHLLVIKRQDFAAGDVGAATRVDTKGVADFAVEDARVALARRAAGEDLKAVFVVSRQAGAYQVLVVRESILARDPVLVEQVVAQFERARRWLIAHPQDGAALLAHAGEVSLEAAQERLARGDFQVARPGPALAQVLKSAADPRQAAHVDPLIDDGPMRAAIHALRQDERTALLGLR